MANASRKPDYIMTVKVKPTGDKGDKEAKRFHRIGAAWEDEQGISIQLDPCAVISWKDNVYINLYRINDKD
jgi:hypothetical protein